MKKTNLNNCLIERAKKMMAGAPCRLAATAALAVTLVPAPAYASGGMSAKSLVDTLLSLVSNGAILIGLIVAVFGGISVGTNVAGATQGNGGAISSGVAMIVGGLIVAAAGALVTQMDTSWLVV